MTKGSGEYQSLPNATEKSKDEKSCFALTKTTADAKKGVDSHGNDKCIFASECISDGSPTVPANQHSNKENG